MRRPLALAVVLFTVTAAMFATTAAAQDDPEPVTPSTIAVTTDYPIVTAEAGDTLTLDLEVVSPDRVEVAVRVSDAPDDWTTTLRGGGFVVGGVTADPDSPVPLDLEIVVPPTAEQGEYQVVVRADGPATLDDDLVLTVVISDRPVGGIALTTDFAMLRGRPTDSFRFDLEVTNQTPEEITLAFDASGPDGWNVTAGPASEERASTVTVGAGATESVRVEADPAAGTAAGSYPIEVRATGGGQSGTFTLTAEVTGQASIELVSDSGRLDLSGNPGKVRTTTVFVVNDGSAPLEDVQLSADPPADWVVEFDPDEIPTVAAGDSVPVEVTIRPTGDAVAGDYAIGLTARGGGETSELAYRFTVETSRWWGAIGIAIIVAALVVLAVVFRRFGRR